MPVFKLVSDFTPKGDQPQAIKALSNGLDEGKPHQVLLGVTGSGKTFTIANVIQHYQRPTLVISHNKTLAAQLYSELKEFFPHNTVNYFVSYYDYYQPEAYIPQKDIYIEKDASINEDIDRLRLAATSSLMSRQDVIIVASVSCIYGLGSPSDYREMMVHLKKGACYERDDILRKLVEIQYDRNDVAFSRGKFRVRGDVVEVFPAYEEFAVRFELFGDELESIYEVDALTGSIINSLDEYFIYPAKHFVLPEGTIESAAGSIETELEERLSELRGQGKLLEAQRLDARTRYDLEMLREVGYCSGIENYSRHLAGRPPGSRPYVLLDYFGDSFLTIVDESHVTIPQVRGMYAGDNSRKTTLVEHGFRLLSALDNRPLRFNEWEELNDRVIYVSATPGPYELEKTGGDVVEQIIRPTGLVDPIIRVQSAQNQVEHLLGEVRERIRSKERALVTTLTKKLAERLADYMKQEGFKCSYLHSEIKTIERVEILRDLRLGKFDVVVGVNLLREGLDLPEVSLVAILDADKEGFLRSETSLIQTIGRTARNVNAEVILYADRITGSMQRAIDETDRRRRVQVEYNKKHGIKPETIRKAIKAGIEEEVSARRKIVESARLDEMKYITLEQVRELEEDMYKAAENLDFEEAARLRNVILKIQTAHGIKPYFPGRMIRKATMRRRKQ